MSFAGRDLSEDTKGWLRHVAWTAFSAAVTAAATKLTELAVEEFKARRAARANGKDKS